MLVMTSHSTQILTAEARRYNKFACTALKIDKQAWCVFVMGGKTPQLCLIPADACFCGGTFVRTEAKLQCPTTHDSLQEYL